MEGQPDNSYFKGDSLERRKKVEVLYRAGISSPREIIKRTGYKRTQVCDTLRRLRAGKSVDHRPGAGVPARIGPDGRKCVEDFVTQNPKSTAASIAAHLEKNGPAGEDVTSTSIRRYMKKWGYKYDTALKIYYHPKEAKRNPQVLAIKRKSGKRSR